MSHTRLSDTHAAVQLAPVQRCLKTLIFKTTLNRHTHTNLCRGDIALLNVLFLAVRCPNEFTSAFSSNTYFRFLLKMCLLGEECLKKECLLQVLFNFLSQFIHFGMNGKNIWENPLK